MGMRGLFPQGAKLLFYGLVLSAALFLFEGCGYQLKDAERDGMSGEPYRRRKAEEYLCNFLAERVKSSRDYHQRLEAIRLLGKFGQKRAINTLRLILMYETDSALRREAIYSLQNLKAREALSELREVLSKNRDLDVKMAAIAALGSLGDRKAFSELKSALQDIHPGVRRASVRALFQIEASQALPLLFRALNDPHPDVVVAAEEALVKFGPRAVPLLVRGLMKDKVSRERAIRVLIKIGRPAWPFMFRALAEKQGRENLIYALAKVTGDQFSWKVLAELIDRGEDERGFQLIKSLEKRAQSPAIPAVAELWPHFSAGYRIAFRDSLGIIAQKNPPEGCRELSSLIEKKGSLSLKVTALFAVGYCGKTHYPLIKKYLASKNNALKIAAIYALSRLREAGLEDLKRLASASNGEERLRKHAIQALGKLDSPKAVDFLIELLKDPAAEIRIIALKSLAQQGDRKAIPAVRKLLKDPLNDVVLAAIHTLLKLGDQQNAELYITAVERAPFPPDPEYIKTLREIGDQSIIPILKNIAIEYLRYWREYTKKAQKLYARLLKIGMKKSAAKEEVKRRMSSHLANNPNAICSFIESLNGLIKFNQPALKLMIRWGYRANRTFDPLRRPPRSCPWKILK